MPGPYSPADVRNYVGIGKQASRGTAIAPAVWVPFLPSVDLDHQQALNRIMEAGNAGQVSYAEKTAHLPTGGFAFLARPSLTPKLCAYLLGIDTVTGVGPFTHTITDDLATDYLSIEQNLADEAIERFVDGVIAELVFTVDADNPVLRCTGRWIGARPAFQAAATAESYETEEPWRLNEAAFTIDGVARTNVRGFTATVRFRLSPEKIADVVPEYVQKHGLESELQIVQLALNDDDEYRKVHYGSGTGTTWEKLAEDGAFIANFTRATRRLQLRISNLDYHQAQYTQLSSDAGEATRITREAVGRRSGSTSPFDVIADNGDSAAYVT